MSMQQHADALRVEISVIVHDPRAPIAEFAGREYIDLCKCGVEHHAARDMAVESAINGFNKRADLARRCGHLAEAQRFFQPAYLLMRSWQAEAVTA